MKLETNVGQILLTHPKDENYTSLYEETIRKQGKAVQLFMVMETTTGDDGLTSEKKRGYKKLEQTIASSLKKAYVASDVIDEAAFERALATVNTALSQFASRSRVKWFGKTNVILAAFYQNKLSLSSTGNAQAYLVRDGETNQLTDEIDSSDVKPVKIFSAFTTGNLKKGDRVILSTNQIFNYLSIQRIKDFVSEDRLSDACEDIIEALQDVKNTGFATFIFEATESGAVPKSEKRSEDMPVIDAKPQPISLEKIKSQKTLYFILTILLAGLKNLGWMLWSILQIIARLFNRGSKNISLSKSLKKPKEGRKKMIQIAIGLALVVLLISVSVAAWNRSVSNNQIDIDQKITEAENQLNDAEARLIFEDGDRAIELVAKAEELIDALEGQTTDQRYEEQVKRLKEIKQKVEKKIVVENPTVLAEFANIPTELLRSPNGMLGFNRNSGSLSFYDFRTGQTQSVLSGENTSSLILGGFVGGTHGYVFLDRNGNFATLNVDDNTLSSYETEPSVTDLEDRKIQALDVFGQGDSARIYLLDSLKSEIQRANLAESGVSAVAPWLDEEASFSDSIDFSVDGNIYILFADRLEKYFRGSKQDFALAQVLPALRSAVKVYASAEAEFIYILDPSNERILVFDKDGNLANQIISERFRELTDIYPDERTNILYILSGAELLQVNLP